MSDKLSTATLKQGVLFNKYQNKIIKNTIKKKYLKRNVSVVEGFDTSTNTNITEVENLQSELNTLLGQYNSSQNQLMSKTNEYVEVTSSTNPYFNKNIRFNNGTICYVTSRGIARPYTSEEVFKNNSGKNGCPSKEYIDVNIPWLSSYTEGKVIPTNPPLMVGKIMRENDVCGNEGSNVFVNSMVTNPSSSSYVGCYNDISSSLVISIIPGVSSNDENEIIINASSTYLNNDNTFGPWHVFDQNVTTIWYTSDNPNNIYNSATGIYEGKHQVTFFSSGIPKVIPGEWLEVIAPVSALKSYSILPNQSNIDLANSHSPNSWYVIGIKSDNSGVQLDYQENQEFNLSMKTYVINNTESYYGYILLITKVGNNNKTTDRNCVQIASWNLYSDTNTNFDDSQRAMTLDANIGYLTEEKCKQYAIDRGFKYYGLQNKKPDGTSACLVSNNITRTKMYGESNIITAVPIWSSNISNPNTSNTNVNNCTLTNSGQLLIKNNNNEIRFETPSDPLCAFGGGINSIQASWGANCPGVPNQGNVDSIISGIIPNGTISKSYRIGDNFTRPQYNPTTCFGSYSSSYKCGGNSTAKIIDISGQGVQSWQQIANYDCSAEVNACKYTLILQDDGNVCIYKDGSNVALWSTNTINRIQDPNPNWVASKGKNGVNKLVSGERLNVGEWIGSTNGSLKLMMQRNGNLVLYTSNSRSGCSAQNGKMVGSEWVNAVYEINKVGVPENLNKFGYVTPSGSLVEYPSSMIKKGNTYEQIPNYDSIGNNLASLPLENSSEETCKSSCNSDINCAGFVFDKSNKKCWKKDNNIFPKGLRQQNNNMDIYIRNSEITNLSSSCNKTINNIDTNTWENYFKDGNMSPSYICGIEKLNETKNVDLTSLKIQIANLANQIVFKMNNLQSITLNLNDESAAIKSKLLNNLDYYKEIQSEFSKYTNNNNMNNILSETDIEVLKGNYNYMFWSILAIAFVIITINITKKK